MCGQFAPNRNILQCSKSCGTGIQTRRVECMMRRGNHGPEVPVKDEQCIRSKSRKPKSQRLCQRIACDFIWQEGTWSEVSLYLKPYANATIFPVRNDIDIESTSIRRQFDAFEVESTLIRCRFHCHF